MTGDNKRQEKQLRRFGVLVGSIFIAIGLGGLVLHGAEPRLWAVTLGMLLILVALVRARVLGPVHRMWMALGDALGWINTRVLLGLVFYGLVTPMGLVMRLVGRDPMNRTFDRDADTYRVARRPRQAAHMTRQF
jgi:hypothetical protein